MEVGARRLQRLGAACLVLAAVMAPPALSAAQEEAPAGSQPAPASTPPAPPAPAPSPDQGATDPDADKDPADKQDTADKAESLEAAAPSTDPAPAPAPAAATGKQPKAVAAASALVSMGDNFYSPRTVSIAVGDTVTWRNNGQAQHSATANDGSFDTGVYGPGQSRSHTFNAAGTFTYFCTVHGSAQSGTVRVASAGGGGGDDAGSSGADQSEADAVASAGAAGDSNTLPMTGYASGALALVGLALLAAGFAVRRLENLSFPVR